MQSVYFDILKAVNSVHVRAKAPRLAAESGSVAELFWSYVLSVPDL